MGLGYRSKVARVALVTSLLVAVLSLVARPVRADTYWVTNTKDDASPGSLRRAIIDANNHPGPDPVEFDVPPSDPGYSGIVVSWQILPLSPLPRLTDNATIIDGATQTTNQADTNGQGPEVQIDGSKLGGDASIFHVQSNANQILSLVLTSAPGPAIRVNAGAAGNIIRDNYIGTDPSGSGAMPNGAGIHVTAGASENVIAHNVISGNAHDGIVIAGYGTEYNMIRRNYIGLNPSGTADIPNGWDGVAITGGAARNEVGVGGYRNYIGGNGRNGIFVEGSGTKHNSLYENYIGIDAAGKGTVDVGNSQNGIAIVGGASSTWVAENGISGKKGNGALIEGVGTQHFWFASNMIGTDTRRTAPVPNGLHGIPVYDGADHVTVPAT